MTRPAVGMRRWLELATPLLVLLAYLGTPAPAPAQDVMSIVAVVNEDVISMWDLQARTKLAISTAGLRDDPDTRRRIERQVLRSLIDEKIQTQEADRLNIRVSDGEVRRALSRVEQSNGMGAGGIDRFLQERNLERFTLEAQLRSQIAWQKLVQRRLRPQLDIGDEEIDAARQQIIDAQGTAQALVSELYLAVDDPGEEDDVFREAARLLSELRKGADFTGVAAQFSQSASAAVGGDLGWVQQGSLGPELEAALRSLSPGQYSDPIRVLGGVTVLWLRDRRILGAPDPNEIVISLRQIFLPVEQGADEEQLIARIKAARDIRGQLTSCAAMQEVEGKLGGVGSGDLGRLRLADLPPDIRERVDTLEIGQPSIPIERPNGVQILMVCDKQVPKTRIPSRDEVRQRLELQRLDLLARRYLRDLRRQAFLDIRL